MQILLRVMALKLSSNPFPINTFRNGARSELTKTTSVLRMRQTGKIEGIQVLEGITEVGFRIETTE